MRALVIILARVPLSLSSPTRRRPHRCSCESDASSRGYYHQWHVDAGDGEAGFSFRVTNPRRCHVVECNEPRVSSFFDKDLVLI